jgi:predicted nucleotidyltransferase
MSSNRINIINEISSLLSKRRDVKFAYLFGSRALGYGRLDSDVDLAVFFDEGTSALARVELEEEVSKRLGLPVQVVSLNEKLSPRFLRNILVTGVVVKEDPKRKDWEGKVKNAIGDSGEEDYKSRLLGMMEEMTTKIQRALPLLDRINIEEVKREEIEAVRDFVGAFMLLFEPFEAAVRWAINYARLAFEIEEVPPTLKGKVRTVIKLLNLEEGSFEQFKQLIDLRNKIAHVYWEVADISSLDLREVKDAFEEFSSKLKAFVISEKLP